MAASTAAGGGAAAVKNSTTCGSGFFSFSGALSSVAITIGAPQRCVTLWFAIASYLACARARAPHDRRAAERRHLVVRDRVVHRWRAHRAQTHVRASHHRNGPRKAPAVAV